jgi:hypothetical protein
LPADVVVPLLEGALGEEVRRMCAPLAERHRLVEVSVDGLVDAMSQVPTPLSSMGRGLAADPAYFLAAAAAGRHAASLL